MTHEAEPPLDTRPRIRIELGHPEEYIVDSIASLGADPDIFKRDKELVHVTRVSPEEQLDDNSMVEGTPKIHSMAIALLRVRMCKWARWERKRKDGTYSQCEPTRTMADEVSCEKNWAGIRSLCGISETPFLRPDGTVVQGEAHYDRSTGYLYEPTMRFLPVADAPSREDARHAYEALADIFVDFPFASDAGVSAAVAAVLTMIGRPAINGPVPAWVIDATSPGTGKTLLADIFAAVAYGRDSGRAHFPSVEGRDSDSELQKRLGMVVRMGMPMVNFDNCDEVVIGGDVLEDVISAKNRYLFRILGVTDGLNLPVRVVFCFTANNASWSRGMNRRVLHVRLASPLAKPESRPLDTYRHPERAGGLFDYVLKHRAEYVKHALTLLRAYAAAGYPDRLTLGTFESWAGIVPSAIVWAGGVNPMLCRPAESGEENPEDAQRAVLIREWAAFCQASEVDAVTAPDVVERLYPSQRGKGDAGDPKWEALRGAVEFFAQPSPGRDPDHVRLVKVITRKIKDVPTVTHDAPMPLQRLVRDGKTGGRMRWRVEPVPQAKRFGASAIAEQDAIAAEVSQREAACLAALRATEADPYA